jgi:hypothetical protein
MLWFHLLVAEVPLAIVVARAPDASDCPDTANLAARVARITEGAGAAPGSATSSVAVAFSRVERGYEASIRLRGARDGERILHDEGPTCDALADAVAVTTALLFDPSAHAPGSARATDDHAPAFWGISVVGRAGLSLGLLGGASWSAGAGLEISTGPLTSVHLAGVINGARENELGAGSVKVDLWFLEVGAFHSFTGEAFRFGPAIALMVGALRGEGAAYPVTSAASLPWFAVGAGLGADFGVGSRLRLGARSLLVVPTRQQSFSVGYVGRAYESSEIAGIADLVAAVRLW